MARLASPRARTRPRFEIIPFIDIMFFLLATFVTVSMKLIQNHGIAVNLPVATTAAAQPRSDEVDLTLTEKNGLLWDKEPIAIGALPGRLQSLKQSRPDPHIFINGDAKAAFGRAVDVLDAVRRTGIAHVAIETEPAPAKAPAP